MGNWQKSLVDWASENMGRGRVWAYRYKEIETWWLTDLVFSGREAKGDFIVDYKDDREGSSSRKSGRETDLQEDGLMMKWARASRLWGMGKWD